MCGFFSSNNIENIKVAKERLLWGFWHKEIGEKQKRNWGFFNKLYHKINPFDSVIFQYKDTGEIHALGVVKRKYYDDETLVWPEELSERKVLFPWRVEFCFMLFSTEPFITYFLKTENYVEGYGIGEVPEFEFRLVFENIKKRFELAKLEFNIGITI
ncbi:MAG: hypothetical protein ABIM60_00795 [candidate division WOR-3 bacterium]